LGDGGTDSGSRAQGGTPRRPRSASRSGLTPKQSLFVHEYLVDLNATQAAIRAGYAPKSADVNGPRLLGNAGVRAAIDAGIARRKAKLELKAERLDEELARACFFDPARLVTEDGKRLDLHELDEDTRRAIRSVEIEEIWEGRGDERAQVGQLVKIRAEPKVEALSLAYKRLGLLKDKVEHEHTFKSHAELVAEAARRLAEKRGGGQ
jgi:phage terminase small subunit